MVGILTDDGEDCIIEELKCDMGRCHHPTATAKQIHDCEVKKLAGRYLRMLAEERNTDQKGGLHTDIGRLDSEFTTSIWWIVAIGSSAAAVGVALLRIKKYN